MAAMMPLCCCAASTSSAPNIVYVLSDNLGYGGVGFLLRAVSPAGPSREIQTPNIDSLALSGVSGCQSGTLHNLQTVRCDGWVDDDQSIAHSFVSVSALAKFAAHGSCCQLLAPLLMHGPILLA